MNVLHSIAAGDKAQRAEKYLLAALVLLGVLVRLVALGQYPGGVNQDEAYSAYEAYCLLTDGLDSWGYRYPVYLTAWGSGMNALQSYLIMPFIRLFGMNVWVIRLPQALLACIGLLAVYALMKRLFDRHTALIALAFLAICPWHIMMARWGLESNLAPGMVLLGFLFFVMGMERPAFYLVSGLCYGLSLYAYATIWPVLPFLIALQGLYVFYTRKLKWSWQLFGGVVILGILAIPLLLFLAVNWGMVDEIHTPLISVPRILEMRSGDISLNHLYENVYRMVKTFLLQRDDMVWNASDEFGLYYHISLPFMVIGGFVLLIRTLKSIRTRQFDGSALILIWLLLGAVQGCMIDGNVNRLNFLHFPLILCAVMGITWTVKKLRGRGKGFAVCIAAAYAVSFVLFTGFYFTDFQKSIADWYDTGLEEALSYAEEVSRGEVCVSEKISYPKILFYGQIEPQVFRDTVVWRGEPSAFMSMESVDRYRFGVDAQTMTESVCVVKAYEVSGSLSPDLCVKVFDEIAVVHPADLLKN